ncbi:MAG: lipopolysaccharide assembly protein LapA domain-containing protein [Alphaproteobacteria bacterium]
MIRFVSSIIFIFFASVLIWFVVSNTQDATLRLAILAPEGLVQPMAIWIIATCVVSFVLGVLFVWVQASSRRSALRKANRSLNKTQDELDRLRADMVDREAEIVRLEEQIAALKTIDQPVEEVQLQPLPAI